MSASRVVVFVALLVSALVALVSAQGNCVAPDYGCTSIQLTTMGSTSPLNLVLFLYYEPNLVVCDLAIGSTISSSTQGADRYIISDVPGTFSGSVTQVSATNPALSSITLTFQATGPGGTGTGTLSTPAGASVGNVASTPQGGGIQVTFPLLTTVTETLGPAVVNSCTFMAGDPLFTGFRGQQFYIGGEDGQVMNLLSSFNTQVNGRFVMLDQGQAIMPEEQDKIRLLSEARHLENNAVAAFPRTTPWSHPGNYFGEVGVAMVDESRLFAKAGLFESGFAQVTLNGKNLPVSDDYITLGKGANTTYVLRSSAHEVMVRTVNVEFTIVNSDNFLNVDNIHLEKGVRQYSHFSGLLGGTTSSKWAFSVQEVLDSVVQSGDLFEHTAVEA